MRLVLREEARLPGGKADQTPWPSTHPSTPEGYPFPGSFPVAVEEGGRNTGHPGIGRSLCLANPWR